MSAKEQDAESKLKESARKIFLEKGFAATKTREIAEAAGINLALLNYYFRSKKKLYDLIMMETIQQLYAGLFEVIDDEATSLREKLAQFVERYIDMLTENPDIAFFILGEIKQNPKAILDKLKVADKIGNSVIVRQFLEGIQKGEIPPINPLHFMMNLAGMVVFPFLASPAISEATGIDKEVITAIIQERKQLIPKWIDAMLTVKN